MKIIGTFGVVVAASIALLQPAEGRGGRSGGGSFHSSAPHFSNSAGHSSRANNAYRSAPHYYSPAMRSSSQAAFRNKSYTRSSPRFSAQSASRNRVATNSRQFTANRTAALRPQALNNSNRIIARHSASQHPNWDRRHDHFWHGHRCHWHNNAWAILGLGFYPWGYDYGYPYGAYYYDDGYYDNGYAANDYSQSEYDNGDLDSSVRQVQAALAREGYYHGAIDGSFGPATQNAVRRYQRNHGLGVTGEIDRPVIQALGLR